MLSNIHIQQVLRDKGLYLGLIDGILGPVSMRAVADYVGPGIAKWSDERQVIACVQLICREEGGCDPGKIDGYYGAMTDAAVDCYEAKLEGVELVNDFRDYTTPTKATRWPKQRSAAAFYGAPGHAVRSQLVTLRDIPYALDYFGTAVSRVTLHKKCADSWLRIQEKILFEYGEIELRKLNIHRYGGTYNHRKMRGGSSWSMHAYGCAEDRWPMANRLRWGRDRAAFARSEYLPMMEAYESEGWVNLGRERNFDFMHFQAARL